MAGTPTGGLGFGCGAGAGFGSGTDSFVCVDFDATWSTRASCPAGSVAQRAQTATPPPEAAPSSGSARAVVLILLNSMVFRTPWVKERTEAGTACLAANRIAASRV